MKTFIFRNNTIEQLFGSKETEYSGYDDISQVPQDADVYVWFYQVPFKYDRAALTAEVEGYWQKFEMVWQRMPQDKTVVIFTLVDLYGIEAVKGDNSLRLAIDSFNRKAAEAAQSHTNVKVLHTDDFLSRYDRSMWIDWKFYFISQAAINPRLAKDFKKWYARRMEEIESKRKKCIVLDLDNTLWGGVLGEDGIEGIKIGGDYPGKAFLYFQEALAELSKTGVILTVCSKNNEADVLEAWQKNPFIVLNKDYISAYRINWDDKASNIKALATELNIGLDSMVFIDDNPTERELIKQMLPMVAVPDFPAQPYELPAFFKQITDDYFALYSLTEEDRKKTEQYKANAKRAEEQSKFTDFSDYLRSLDIHLKIQRADGFNTPRIAQMTQKTNQFNLTTRRYTEADIKSFAADGAGVWCISVSDKFGDNGITGAIIATKQDSADSSADTTNTTAIIDTMLLSCRILGKGIEEAFLNTVLNQLKDEGITKVKAQYLPTLKNSQVKDFYDRMGFKLVSRDEDGAAEYELTLGEEREVKEYFQMDNG